MGYYIQGPTFGKAKFIVDQYGGEIIGPTKPSGLPDNKALICVVSNIGFEAAGYCYDDNEFLAFYDLSDPRPKTWVLVDKSLVEQLTGYQK